VTSVGRSFAALWRPAATRKREIESSKSFAPESGSRRRSRCILWCRYVCVYRYVRCWALSACNRVSVLRAGALAHGTIPACDHVGGMKLCLDQPLSSQLALTRSSRVLFNAKWISPVSRAVNRAASLWGERASRRMTFVISREGSLAITRNSALVTFHSPSMETRIVTVRRVWNGDWSRFQIRVSSKNQFHVIINIARAFFDKLHSHTSAGDAN